MRFEDVRKEKHRNRRSQSEGRRSETEGRKSEPESRRSQSDSSLFENDKQFGSASTDIATLKPCLKSGGDSSPNGRSEDASANKARSLPGWSMIRQLKSFIDGQFDHLNLGGSQKGFIPRKGSNESRGRGSASEGARRSSETSSKSPRSNLASPLSQERHSRSERRRSTTGSQKASEPVSRPPESGGSSEEMGEVVRKVRSNRRRKTT